METVLKFKAEKNQFESSEIFVRPNDVISVKIANDRMSKIKRVFRNMVGVTVTDDLSNQIVNNNPPKDGYEFTVLFFTAPANSFDQKDEVAIEYEIENKS